MDNFALFICGIVVALISGMGVITSRVSIEYYDYLKLGYFQKKAQKQLQERRNEQIEQIV